MDLESELDVETSPNIVDISISPFPRAMLKIMQKTLNRRHHLAFLGSQICLLQAKKTPQGLGSIFLISNMNKTDSILPNENNVIRCSKKFEVISLKKGRSCGGS